MKNIQYFDIPVSSFAMKCKVVSYKQEQSQCNLVIVPGYSLTAEVCEGLAQALCSEGFIVYVIDCLVLREIELSADLLMNHAFFRPTFYGDCLHQVIRMLQLKDFSLITHSMGSHITLKMLEKDHSYVRSLFMLNPAGMTHSIRNIPFAMIRLFQYLLDLKLFVLLLLASTKVRYVNKLFVKVFRYLAGNPIYKSSDLKRSIDEITSNARTFQSGTIAPLYSVDVETCENFDFNILKNIKIMLVFAKGDQMLSSHAQKINGKYILSDYRTAWYQHMKSIDFERVEIHGGHEVLFEENHNGVLARKLLLDWLHKNAT